MKTNKEVASLGEQIVELKAAKERAEEILWERIRVLKFERDGFEKILDEVKEKK